jgi:hypothetical protein
MNANRVLNGILAILSFIIVPIQMVTTLILGLGAALTFGLLLIPMTLFWCIIFLPMLGLSWLSGKANFLRELIGFLGIPWAIFANIYACLMPAMGEVENRTVKLFITETWPFSWDFWLFYTGELDLDSPQAEELNTILEKQGKDPLRKLVIQKLRDKLPLDENVGK